MNLHKFEQLFSSRLGDKTVDQIQDVYVLRSVQEKDGYKRFHATFTDASARGIAFAYGEVAKADSVLLRKIRIGQYATPTTIREAKPDMRPSPTLAALLRRLVKKNAVPSVPTEKAIDTFWRAEIYFLNKKKDTFPTCFDELQRATWYLPCRQNYKFYGIQTKALALLLKRKTTKHTDLVAVLVARELTKSSCDFVGQCVVLGMCRLTLFDDINFKCLERAPVGLAPKNPARVVDLPSFHRNSLSTCFISVYGLCLTGTRMGVTAEAERERDCSATFQHIELLPFISPEHFANDCSDDEDAHFLCQDKYKTLFTNFVSVSLLFVKRRENAPQPCLGINARAFLDLDFFVPKDFSNGIVTQRKRARTRSQLNFEE